MHKLSSNKFNPEIKYFEIEYLIDRINQKDISNTAVYNLVRKLTDTAFPTYENQFDKRWNYFYLPVKRSGRLISLPFSIMEYKKEFYISFNQLGNSHIRKGSEKLENEYNTIFKEALRFIPLVKKTDIIEKTVPYDIRTGRIKGKYILKELMPNKEKEYILSIYNNHNKKELKADQISLDEYLNTAAICYRSAYKKEIKRLSPLEMYKRLADGRDGGMLSIKNRDSREEFTSWMESGKWTGSHPFEIVFSWHQHGIHLYPPSRHNPCYSLDVTNYAYTPHFIKMVKALIKEEIPFQARDLEEVVNHLSGETYFRVNEYDEHFFDYIPSKEYKKLYFSHIEWDKIEIPLWKN